MSLEQLRADARSIWDAAVAAVDPVECVRAVVYEPDIRDRMAAAQTIFVVGGGKAGGAMAAGLEAALADRLTDIRGIINVPAGIQRTLNAIRLNVARPAGSNEPTEAGVDGTRQMLELVSTAGPDDLVIALISGGGSALLPAPVEGVSLEDKQQVTRLLHRSGATISEMNCVRKHLSQIKGGGLAVASRAPLIAFIISDVVGDSLDVIASGPSAADPTTFGDAIDVLRKFGLLDAIPPTVRDYLEAGQRGEHAETPKCLPASVENRIIGDNQMALHAATEMAQSLGYTAVNLGAFVEGESREIARAAAGIVRSIHGDGWPVEPPACVLMGGETTVTLSEKYGRGGRNTEFVLAALRALPLDVSNYVVLSGGTDGEDGPTDAAGAIGDLTTFERATAYGCDAGDSLRRHDSYTFFDATGDLIRTGLTETNVMDVRVLLVGGK